MCSSYSCCLWSLPLKMTSRGICQVTILWLPFIDDLGMSISPWNLLGTTGDSSSALLACVSLGLHLWGGEDTFLAMHPLPIGPCRVEEERDNSTILRYLRELSTLSEISDCGLPIGWLIPPLSGGMRDSARGQQCSQWTNPRGHNLRHSGPDWSQAVPVSGVGPSPQPPPLPGSSYRSIRLQFTPLHRKEIDEHTEGSHSAWSCHLDSFLFLVSSCLPSWYCIGVSIGS